MKLNGHKLTKAQRKVADAVAMGDDSRHNPTVIKRLMEMGIIKVCLYTQGQITVKRYEMPLPVHIEWARQSAQEASDE